MIADPLKPPATLLVKLGSIIVHCDEMLGVAGHQFDRIAAETLINDAEVREWLHAMGQQALVPVKRA